MNAHNQLLPFPLPPYLSRFVASKLNSPIQTLSNGINVKALHVRGKSRFGKMILRNLKQANIPVKKEVNTTLYISVSSYSGSNNAGVLCGENTEYVMPVDIMKDIVEIFEQYYYDCFYEYMEGSISAFAETGKQKGSSINQ